MAIDLDEDRQDIDEEQEQEQENEQQGGNDDEPWSWEEYFDLLSAGYASCEQEEKDFSLAYYDENDPDPAIFLNANLS